jgi:carbonic anhydrase
VAIGLGLAITMLLVRISRAPIVVRPDGEEQTARWRVEIDGTLSFLLLPRLTKMLATLPPGSHVKFRLNADYIDDAVSEAIADWRRAYEANGGVVDIVEKTAADLSRAQTSPPKRRYGARKPTAAGSPNPHTVLLTCADSRVPAAVIAAGAPGAPFTVRNVGNVVPTDPSERSVDAALDFAVNQLGASSVVVCGHSSCPSMAALLADSTDQPATPMRRWLDYAQDSLDAYRGGHPTRASAESQGFAGVDQLSLVNVAIQAERLARQPMLADAVASGAVQVVGMFYDDSKGRAYELDHDGTVRPARPGGGPGVNPAADARPEGKTHQSAAPHS